MVDMDTIHEYLNKFETTGDGGYGDGEQGFTFITSNKRELEGIMIYDSSELNYLFVENKEDMENKHLQQLQGITGVMEVSGMKPMVRVKTESKHDGDWLFTRMTYKKVN